MKRKELKEQGRHSTLSNVAYMLGLMLRVAPGFVISEIAVNLLSQLPPRLIPVLGMKYIVDTVESGGELTGIIYAVAAIIAIMVFQELSMSVFVNIVARRQMIRLTIGIQKLLFGKAVELDMAAFDDPAFYSEFILAMEASGDNIRMTLFDVRVIIVNLFTLLAVGSVVATIDAPCLLIALFFVVAFIPASRRLGNLLVERRVAVTEKHRRGDYFARLFYLPDYSQELRMNGVSPLLIRRFSGAADDIYNTNKKFQFKIYSLYFMQGSLVTTIGLMLCVTAYLGYRTLVSKTMSSGEFIAAFNGSIQVSTIVANLAINGTRRLAFRNRMIEKFRTFLSRDKAMSEGEKIARCGEPEEIRVDNVTFTYPGAKKPALENVSLSVAPREKIALVGYNGAGKTTLTNLLLRLYDPDDGSITVAGEDIRDCTLSSHRARFAAVFQDFRLFGATVGENVAQTPDYDPDRVWMALRKAGFSKELPKGLDTVLLREFDDEGIMLSGGEAQKIAIARVFYKDCPYIIMDEPSANLDPVAEYELNRAIAEEAKERTIIFISHRLSTTVHADRIVMMENSRIIETGTHRELMEKNGKYAEMFRLQAEKYGA